MLRLLAIAAMFALAVPTLAVAQSDRYYPIYDNHGTNHDIGIPDWKLDVFEIPDGRADGLPEQERRAAGGVTGETGIPGFMPRR